MDFAALIAADFSWLSPQSWWAILQVIAGVGFVIFVHELGHFLVAKACGVKCEKFYVGFDFFDIKIGDRVIIPRSLVKFQRGETEYGVGIIPLGGYVKMLGQEDNPSNIEQENRRARGEEGAAAGQDLPATVERPQGLDPRSFMAKSVPQRMAIISAGVIFNLFFAVLLAGFAFRSGAKYTPPAIGGTIVGGPAWRANLGGSIVQSINGKSTTDRYFPFIDLAQETALGSGDGPVTLELTRPGSEEIRTVEVMPEPGVVPGIDLPLLGMDREMSPKISSADSAIIPGQAGARANPSLMPGDEIVSVNGKELPHFLRDGKRLVPVSTMRAMFAENADRACVVGIRREMKDLSVEIPPNPSPTLGLVPGWSPIHAVQADSPADIAGLNAGDRIISIDGQPVSDPLDADLVIVRWMREHFTDGPASTAKIVLTVARAVNGAPAVSGAATEELELTPRWPLEPSMPSAEPLAISTLGVALHPTPVLGAVLAGSPASEAGIQAGDRVRRIRLLPSADVQDKSRLADWIKLIKDLGEKERQRTFFGEALHMIRDLPAGTRFEVTVERDGRTQAPVVLASVLSTGSFLPTRGLNLTELTSVYHSRDWTESLALGARQTWTDAGRIWKTLGKLVTGKISPTNLGGPGTIAMVATSEATEGTSRLLLFLTMLSANLAIINFLPIPVLDGGHMLFLAYEGIFRRPVTEKVQVALSYLGLFFILGLMVFVFSLDIFRIANLF